MRGSEAVSDSGRRTTTDVWLLPRCATPLVTTKALRTEPRNTPHTASMRTRQH